MRYDEMIERIRELGDTSAEQAGHTLPAVLQTLSERIGPKESADVDSELPQEVKDAFFPGSVAEGFSAAEFVRRVAERAELAEPAALEQTRAAFTVLREAVSPGEYEDFEVELSADYVDLAARRADTGGPPRSVPPGTEEHGDVVMGAEEFLKRVSARAGLDEQRAQRAADAVLETFGERIAGGEAEDLALQLPEPEAKALRRPGGNARAMPAEEFVQRVAEREGTLPIVAREHARAVLTTVRESVTADEWRDTVAELPREYQDLIA